MMAFSFLPAVLIFSALFASVSANVSGIPQSDQLTLVHLRIEGRDDTIFERPILTRGHNVTTVSGGTQHCDGTNLGANVRPGPTCTSALDDAAHLDHFSWDGTFSTEFDDYFITSISDSPETLTQFWGILLNFQFTPVGGCQQEVKAFDQVLWAFDAFNKVHFLKLDGPTSARVHEQVTLTVTDGSTGAPIPGATVDGRITDADGHVSIVFVKVGLNGVKAEREDSLRSNKLEVLVV